MFGEISMISIILKTCPRVQCEAPKIAKLVKIHPSNYSYLRTINHSEIGVICTNLAIERGPHIV